MLKRKNYCDLKFIDDYMFCKIMISKPDLCQELLELILGIRIKKIEFQESQKTVDYNYDNKSVRLDVYVEDDENSVYDLEMQTSKSNDIPKRMRYYQSMIDSNLIAKGGKYKSLKKSYIIFICLNDLFGQNLPVYTFENLCRQNNSILLEDGAYKVVINAAGDRSGLSGEMSSFLDFLQDKENDGKLAGELEEAVKEAIQKRLWEEGYGMYTVAMKIEEEIEDAAIDATIESYMDLNASDEAIKKKLMSKFLLSDNSAKLCLEEYKKEHSL